MPLLIILILLQMMSLPSLTSPAFATDISQDLERSDAGPVTFKYQDSQFDQVYIAGSFTDWVRIPLDLEGDEWVLTYWAPPGKHYYRFVVFEGDEMWEAIDPHNSRAINHSEHGWVSVLEIDEDFEYKVYDQDDEERKAEKRKRKEHKKKIRNELKRHQEISGELSYQRVDGLSLNLSTHFESPDGTFEPSARLQGSFGFSSGRFGGGLSVLQPLIPSHLLNLKLSLFDRTSPNSNSTGIGNLENSLAALLLHEDYFDYHRAKGINGSLVFKLGDWIRLEGGVRAEEHSSLGQRSVWSAKKGGFMANPTIDEGNLLSFFTNFEVGGDYNHVRGEYERSGEDIFDGDFEFERISAQLRGRIKLGPDAGFDARVAAGSNLRGTLPAQKRFLLGGLGTVRGYAYQSLLVPDENQPLVPGQQPYGGERSVLGNVEYFFHVGEDLSLALFYDAGMVWQNRSAELTFGDLKTSTGLGVNIGSHDDFRVDVIQRLDDRRRPVVFQFRLKRGF